MAVISLNQLVPKYIDRVEYNTSDHGGTGMNAEQSAWHRSVTDHLITTMGLTPAFVQRFGRDHVFYRYTKIGDVISKLHPVAWCLLAQETDSYTAADTERVLQELNVNVSNDFGLMLLHHAAEAAVALLLQERIDALDLDCAVAEVDETLLSREDDRVTREWQPWMRSIAGKLIGEFDLNAQNTGHEPDLTARFRSRYKPLSADASDALKLKALGLLGTEVEQLGWLTMSGNTADFQEALIALDIDLSQCNTVELYRAAAAGMLFQCVMWHIPRA